MDVLNNLIEATTAEIIEEATKISVDCRDKIPSSLMSLYREKKVDKRISKERKGIIWFLRK